MLTAPTKPCFKAKVLNTATVSAGNNIGYKGIVIDMDGG
jgi:hypothetical protein